MTDAVKHTPGPWKVFNGTDVFPDDNDREGERQIADCAMSHAMPFSEEQANARLIAAAPELLEAAYNALAAGVPNVVAMAIRSAIAKAEGRSCKI